MAEVRDAQEVLDSQEDLAYHQLRVLILIAAVTRDAGHQGKMDGLTKLAKLDFLVRYPTFAVEVLSNEDLDSRALHIRVEDEHAAEAPMVRYKYGPWDDRYYPVIGALVGRGLLTYVKDRQGSMALRPTGAGRQLAASLRSAPAWVDVADRCAAIAGATRGMSGNALKQKIYERLPGAMDQPHRRVIKP